METKLYCTTFDAELQSSLKHLVNYPGYLPFIGNGWESQKDKILFIGESHYLPKTSNGKSRSDTWYDMTQEKLAPGDFQNINTRGVVNDAETRTGFNSPYSIFYNIRDAFNEARQLPKSKESFFKDFAFYNYFQRPAETFGKSIYNTRLDDEIAYKTLKAIVQIAKPTAIIFVSKKAFVSFWGIRKDTKDFILPPVVKCVPHPASVWWNKRSKAYENLTGKDKFINIIKELS
jgi:hypothetical protein